MNRRAVIISNPGETGDEEWLGGVLKDVEHYRAFLLSSIGGLWRRSEVVEMSRPSAAAVRQEVKTLPTYDYVLVIFTGHGWYSTDLESTVLTLRRGQEIDSAELRLATASQTLILDCCRRKHPGMPEVRSLIADMAKAAPAIHPDDCRKYYNRRIRECGSELVVMHACEAGEAAGDDSQKGGVYSYNLLRSSKAWAGTSPVDTSENYAILSVVQAHGATVPLVRQSQTPHIEKPRTGPYYPFCVVA